ncbi:MAG: hypothetical protein ACO2ZD_00610 [Pseudomonadales bacterium]
MIEMLSDCLYVLVDEDGNAILSETDILEMPVVYVRPEDFDILAEWLDEQICNS